MQNDAEKLAKAFLGDKTGEKVSGNYGKFAQIMQSAEGKNVISSLMSDGGEMLKKAADGAKKGDMVAAQQIISNLIATKEGADIIKKIIVAASE